MPRAKRVWITGVTGFTGRHLVAYLRSLPDDLELIGIDCRPAKELALDAFHEVDLTDLDAIKAIAGSAPPDRVLHLAGLFPPAPEAEMWRVNVGGTQTLLSALADRPNLSLRIVSIGSAAEYLPSTKARLAENDPCGGHSLYGRTKWAQTCVALGSGKERNLHVTVARTFNLLGPGLAPSLVAGSLCRQFNQRGSTVTVGDLRPLRDFVDVRDAVAAYWLICEKGRRGQVFNVCRGKATRIQTLLKHIAALSPQPKRIVSQATPRRAGESDRVCGDNTCLQRLGWTPAISLNSSLRDMMEFAS